MNALAPPRERLPRRREWPHLGPWLLLFAIGFAIRAGALWITRGWLPPHGPAADIDAVAWNLASGAGFSLDRAAGPHPTAVVPPVLPWLLSLVYRAAGHHGLAALLLQGALGSLVPLLLVALAGVTFGLTTGRLAAWVAIFDPLLVLACASLNDEMPFTVALFLALLATAEWVKTPRRGRSLGTGVLWGLGALTRPAAIVLPLFVMAWAWTPLGLTLAPRERVRQALFLLLGVTLALAPWTVRNAIVLHAFVPVSTGTGAPSQTAGATAGGSGPREPVTLDLEHARELPARAGRNLARFWDLVPRVVDERPGEGPGPRLPWAIDWLAPWFVGLFAAALWGFARTMTGARRWFQALPALVILYFGTLATLAPGSPRLRVPVEPALALYAAVGLEDLRHRWRARARGLRLVSGKRRGAE